MTSFAFILGVLPLAVRDRRRIGGAQLGRHGGGRRHAGVDVPVDHLHSGAVCRDSHDRAWTRHRGPRRRPSEALQNGRRACVELPARSRADGRWPAAAVASRGLRADHRRRIEFDEAVAPRDRAEPDRRRGRGEHRARRSAAAAVARGHAAVVSARSHATSRSTARAGSTAASTQPQNQSVFSASVQHAGLSLGTMGDDRIRRAIRSTSRRCRPPKSGSRSPSAPRGVSRGHRRSRQVDVDERALESARAHLDYAQKRLEGGAGSRLNQLRAAQRSRRTRRGSKSRDWRCSRAQEALGVLVVGRWPVDAGAEPCSSATAGPEADWTRGAAGSAVSRPPSSARPSASSATAGRTGCRPPRVRSIRRSSRRPGCFSRRARGALVDVDAARSSTAASGRPRALREVTPRSGEARVRGLEIQARSEVRLAQETVAALERALASARSARTGQRSAEHHDHRVRSRRDDEHRSDRRAASPRATRHALPRSPRTRCAAPSSTCWSRSGGFRSRTSGF